VICTRPKCVSGSRAQLGWVCYLLELLAGDGQGLPAIGSQGPVGRAGVVVLVERRVGVQREHRLRHLGAPLGLHLHQQHRRHICKKNEINRIN
jgi:hypothetical protein